MPSSSSRPRATTAPFCAGLGRDWSRERVYRLKAHPLHLPAVFAGAAPRKKWSCTEHFALVARAQGSRAILWQLHSAKLVRGRDRFSCLSFLFTTSNAQVLPSLPLPRGFLRSHVPTVQNMRDQGPACKWCKLRPVVSKALILGGIPCFGFSIYAVLASDLSIEWLWPDPRAQGGWHVPSQHVPRAGHANPAKGACCSLSEGELPITV